MASPVRYLSLDIGAQSVSLAEFRSASSGGLVLQKYHISPMDGDQVSDQVRAAQIQIAIKEAMDQLGIKGGVVNYSVSAQSVFTRFVKLPAVDEERVDQIVQFEAQQNVPFPIHEVVWDYQIVHGGETDKMEVALVAIKADLLDDINDSVVATGLKPAIVDVAPMALYNAFRYNYSELGGCSLLVDIGAKTTNLIFMETRKVFSRSIPIGGSTITAAVAKELNLPLRGAEEKKKVDGYVGLGGAYAESSDPEVARLAKIIRNTMTRLHAEITRSISFYRSQQQGTQPVRVFVCGGCANLPYMREFFTEKLQLPIEYFNPLRNVAVASSVDTQRVAREAHQLGELVGLGLRSAHNCPMELNLRPASLRDAQKMEARKPFVIMAGICLLLSIAGWWLYFKRATEIKSEVLSQVETKVSQLQGIEGKFKKVRADIKGLENMAAPLIEVSRDREFWTTILEDIHQRLPERFVWITVFEPITGVSEKSTAITPDTYSNAGSEERSQPGQAAKKPVIDGVRIKGLYLDNPKNAGVVDMFVENLNQSPLLQNAKTERRADPSTDKWAYGYEIQVGLKTPITLP